MYTKRDGKDWFILIDFDLAVKVDKDGQPLGPTSRHRTGTLPFMACDLLQAIASQESHGQEDKGVVHCVRHDFESLYWVTVWCAMSVKRTGEVPDGKESLRKSELLLWESGDYKHIARTKLALLTKPIEISELELSPSFEHLRLFIRAFFMPFWSGSVANDRWAMTQPPKVRAFVHEPFQLFETWRGEVTRDTLLAAFNALEDNKSDSC
jgi:hypothetical protein